MEDSTPSKPKAYAKVSRLPESTKEALAIDTAYKQQSKLVTVAARAAIGHVALAKRNRKDNQQHK